MSTLPHENQRVPTSEIHTAATKRAFGTIKGVLGGAKVECSETKPKLPCYFGETEAQREPTCS